MARSKPGDGSRAKSRASEREKIRRHLQAKPHEELVEMLDGLLDRFPELAAELREQIAVAEGDVQRLIDDARAEIRRVTKRTSWRNSWTNEGDPADYSDVQRRLEQLVALGQADAVVSLGDLLFTRGLAQVEQSDDHGETAGQLASCMPVIFDALAQSTLPPVRKLSKAIDLSLRDGFDLIESSIDVVVEGEYGPTDWSAVADELADRLGPPPAWAATPRRREGRDFVAACQRDRITTWLTLALQRAGRGDEVLALYEREAPVTQSYERLVRLLIEEGRENDAKRWATEGIAMTADEAPGIAARLAGLMRSLAEGAGRWDEVAACAAHELFASPRPERFLALLDAAKRAGCAEAVRRVAMRFLETGVAPVRVTPAKRLPAVDTDDDWPLPVPEHLVTLLTLGRRSQLMPSEAKPHFDVLIGLAIAEGRPDDALRWYDQWQARGNRRTHDHRAHGADAYADAVARALVETRPREAVRIHLAQIHRLREHANPDAYAAIATHLKKMRPILESLEALDEWTQLVGQLREQHRNRRRFLEVLDELVK